MARDRASIRIDMWGDGDWRDLPIGAQHLYMLLLSHPTLSYAGVAEWHPGKLAAMTNNMTPAGVLESAAVLESHGFIVVEQNTDEVLVRSFIKHDGLMKQPKLVVSMTTAYAAVASRRIQLVIAHEVQKMREREPDLRAWEVKQAQTVLTARANSWADVGVELTPGFTPEVTPGFPPNRGQGLAEPTTTATTTSSKEDSAASRGSRVPEDFNISDAMRKWAAKEVPLVDLDKYLEPFKDYWRGVPGAKGVKRDWVGTWRNDMRKKQEFAERDGVRAPGSADPNSWMARTETPDWMRER